MHDRILGPPPVSPPSAGGRAQGCDAADAVALTLRRLRPGEESRLYEVLRSAVHGGTASHYDEAQRRAWAPNQPFEGWGERLGAAETFVAVVDKLIVGFAAVTPAGHVDFAYVLPDLRGTGVGGRLLDRIEEEMRLMGVPRLTTGASLVAEPFFARRGWVAEGQETVERGGQNLRRVRMFKILQDQEGIQAS